VSVSGFTGKGLGLYYALQQTSATEDQTHKFRTFTGFYGQGGLEFGRVLLTGGFGMSLVAQTADDKMNTMLSVIRYHRGISAGVYFHATDRVLDERIAARASDPWRHHLLGPVELRTVDGREAYRQALTQMFKQNDTRFPSRIVWAKCHSSSALRPVSALTRSVVNWVTNSANSPKPVVWAAIYSRSIQPDVYSSPLEYSRTQPNRAWSTVEK